MRADIIIGFVFLLTLVIGSYFYVPMIEAVGASNLLFAALFILMCGVVYYQYRALQAKEQSKKNLLKRLFETRILGFITLDKRGNILAANQTGIECFHLSPDGFNGLHLTDIFIAKDAQFITEQAKHLEGYGVLHELTGKRYKGEKFNVEVILGRTGMSEGADYTLIVRDVSQRRILERDLRKQVNYLKSAETIAGLGHWRLDVATGIMEWSDECYHIHGYKKGDFIPSVDNVKDFIHPDGIEQFHKTYRDLLQYGEVSDKGVIIVRPNGEIRYAQMKGICEKDENGQPVEIFGVLQDITEHKKQEDSLKRHRTELEQRVLELEDLHARLEHQAAEFVYLSEDLAISKEEAERATLAKSEFLATMSHEIRTPMNGVLGMTELLLETPMTGKQRHYAKIAHDSANVLLKIINDILDFSKLEAGKVELEDLVFSTNELMEGVVSLLVERAGDKGVLLETDISTTFPASLRGDPTRIKQILFNLVGNAIKFTEEGHVTLKAEYIASEGSYGKVRFEVKDTGVGILEDRQAQLFDRFTQADTSTTRKFGGTGLGLAICRQLVELMGGDIGVSSVLGEGSTFWFEIDVKSDVDSLTVETKPEDQTMTIADGPTNRIMPVLDILIAEDNEINQILIRALLEKYNQRIEIVNNGEEVINALREKDYDLILMDIQMPVMDGLTATKEIRSMDGEKSQVPIIALTANAMTGQREEYLAAGMNGYVMKPVDQKKLMTEIFTVAGVNTASIPDKAMPVNAQQDDVPQDKSEAAEQDQKMRSLKELTESLESIF